MHSAERTSFFSVYQKYYKLFSTLLILDSSKHVHDTLRSYLTKYVY